MESQIDLMVKEVAKNLGVTPPTPKPTASPEKSKKEMFEPKAKNDSIIAVIGGKNENLAKDGNSLPAEGLLRVCELVNISPEYLFQMYKLMQPNSGTKAEYITLAAVLINEFSAEKNADMIIRMMQRFDSNGQLLKN